MARYPLHSASLKQFRLLNWWSGRSMLCWKKIYIYTFMCLRRSDIFAWGKAQGTPPTFEDFSNVYFVVLRLASALVVSCINDDVFVVIGKMFIWCDGVNIAVMLLKYCWCRDWIMVECFWLVVVVMMLPCEYVDITWG